MHIKSIHVHGFKSYKDTSVDLCKEHNVIVGRNGSGKSNFFEAIRFVFGDDIEQLRSGDNRQSLLHQGLSETNVNATVEIALDNTDQRIPNEGSEVRLMRMVGLKKDEYFISGRRTTKAEVSTLLEIAGLSASNPYYVIAQGKVASLAGMSDEQRLRLLQDVAGTRVYETRRAESLRILEESSQKRASIADLMKALDERLSELAEESAELAAYTEAERKRRAIEYVLFSGEQEKAAEALRELEDAHAAREAQQAEGRAGGGDAEAGVAAFRAAHDAAASALAAAEKALRARKTDLASSTSEASSAKKALPKLQEKRVKLGERAANARSAVEADRLGAAEAGKELARVKADISARRAELDASAASASAAQASADSARLALSAVEQRMNALSDKAGRASRFKSRRDRDAYLTAAAGQHRGELSSAQALLTTHEKEASLHGDRAKKAGGEAAGFDRAAAEKTQAAAALASTLDGLMKQRTAATSRAHGAKANLDDAEKRIAELVARREAADRAVFANMPAALRRGLEEVSRLSDPSSPAYISGIHGPLFELIRPTHERYNLPLEAVAGAELFNVIVSDETVAARIIAHLIKHKAGRVTLVPLNRLKPIDQVYPQTEDSRPITNFVQHDPAYSKAIKQQFGRVLLCKNNEVAAKYAREKGFICVTLDGDTSNQRGALTGGYIDPGSARLKNARAKQDAAAALAALRGEKDSIELEAQRADAEAKALHAQIGTSEDGARKLREEAARLLQDAERRRREAEADRAKAEQAGREAARVREQVALLKSRVDDLDKEMASDMTSKLSAPEQAQLEQLTTDVEAAKKKVAAASAEFEAVRSQRQELTTQLEDNLLKRAAELQKRLARVSAGEVGSDSQDELRNLDEQLRAATSAEDAARSSLQAIQASIAAQEADIARLQDESAVAAAKVSSTADALRDAELQDEKYLEKKRAVVKRKEEAAAKLRDLGTVPTPELDKYSKVKRKALVEELGRVHEKLRGLQHVNKRSSAEYESFTKQKEELEERFSELERGDRTIHDLIESLDGKKDEKIVTTFKGVQKHFRDIFAQLVPRGSASLVLRTGEEDDMGDDGEGGAGAGAGAGSRSKRGRASEVRMERFTGVGIQASFSDAAQTGTISLLSGGQRTLVALALIFAIQRADPAPFYILDEVDAALDPTHRSAVGAMIRKQTEGDNPAQFITSSFGEELLEFGDRWFGVSLNMTTKVSTVEELNQQEAVAFVVAARQDDAAASGGGVAPPATKKARVGAGRGGAGAGAGRDRL